MGVVYHAWDRHKRMDVALKVLSSINADGIYRLKAEFRSLADVSHPNLVGLYDLVSAGPLWFLTMEIVEGRDLLSWVRGPQEDSAAWATDDPQSEATVGSVDDMTVDVDSVEASELTGKGQPKPVALVRRRAADPERLVAAMRQLAIGVRAIHRAGKLHRDIKPSNALVDESGRVVLLDFGLVSDTAARKRDSHHENIISGTPAYMAPEQAMGKATGPAADWYAVGVMLYEALTGQLPFHGTWFQLVEAKRAGPRLRPTDLHPEASEPLSQLAMRLMAFEPEQRPVEAEILGILGVQEDAEEALRDDALDEPPFLGRAKELEALATAFDASLTPGRLGFPVPVVVHVVGAPGAGKSALVREHVARLRKSLVQPVVLQGRCHEREAVPYKALDALVDGLTRWLLQRDRGEVAELLPREIGALAQVFPVLCRVDAVAQAPELREAESLDKRGLRRRAFAVFKQLLRRIAQHRPLVLVIDDMQWGDPDSVELLASLLEPPDASPLLLELIYRAEERAVSPTLIGVRKLAPPNAVGFASQEIALGPMTAQDSCDLARTMMAGSGPGRGAAPVDEERVQLIAKEAQGSPLFVVELVRYRGDRVAAGTTSASTRQVSLDYVIGARVAQLSPPALRLLRVIAVAGRPVAQQLAVEAAQLDRDARAILLRMRASHFVRTAGDDDRDTVETFHNRVRELVIRGLELAELRTIHASWATVLTRDSLAQGGQEDVDGLAYHWLGAGEEDKALHYTVQAARRAHAVHANHDAVRDFETALTILVKRSDAASSQLRVQIEEEAAQSARQAGMYQRAAELLGGCLQRATTKIARADIHVGLGQVYQEMGESERAIEELETALRYYGQAPPSSTAALVLQTLGQYLVHQWHTTLARPRPQEASPVLVASDPTLQKRVDTMFALIRIYYFVDVLRVTWAGMYAVNMARKLPRDADRALAWSFYGVILVGLGMLDRSARWCEEAVYLARSAHDPVAEGVSVLRLGTNAMFQNDLPRAERTLREAIDIFKEVGEMWELQTGLMLTGTTRLLVSDFRGAIPLYEEMGLTGIQINAIMHQAWAKTWTPFCRYILGELQAQEVKQHHEEALELSARVRDLANTVATLQLMTTIAVREGQVERSAGLAIRTREAVSRYLVQVPFLQSAWVAAGEAALFALESGAKSAGRSTLLSIARKGFRVPGRLGKNYPYLAGPALRIRARYLALTSGPDAAEPVFRKAIEVLERTPNRWETGVALYDAAKALPARRQEYLRRAIRIFQEIGAEAELRRAERELNTSSLLGPLPPLPPLATSLHASTIPAKHTGERP